MVRIDQGADELTATGGKRPFCLGLFRSGTGKLTAERTLAVDMATVALASNRSIHLTL